MNRWLKLGIVVVVVMAVWALGPPAAIWAYTAGNGVGTSPHDFTSTAPNTTFKNTGITMCETCHVPHGAGAQVLLWDQGESKATSITFGSGVKTVGGTALPENIKTWTGTTKHCLSCHDGSVAVGQGWSTAGTAKISGSKQIGTSAGDLTGNHPVAIPYAAETAKYNNIQSGYTSLPTNWVAAATVTGAKLAKDPSTSAYGLECATCHDPHNKEAAALKFLRTAYSDLCTKCHQK